MPYFGQLYLYVCPSLKKHFSYIICRRPNLQKWPRIMSAMPAFKQTPLRFSSMQSLKRQYGERKAIHRKWWLEPSLDGATDNHPR